MGWTYSVIWFVSVCECFSVGLTNSLMRGEIQSTLYPLPYPTGLKREWNILGRDGHQIQLSITHLDIKPSAGCSQDSLTVVYDQQILGKFCGQENSTDHPGKEPIRSPGNRLTLIFQSSNSTSEVQQHIGFSATYKSIVIDCGKPEPLLNGRFVYLSTRQTARAYFECNEPYYFLPEDANAIFTCGLDGKWKSSNNSGVTPTCIPAKGCEEPGPLLNGEMIKIYDQFNSYVYYRCNEPFYSLPLDLNVFLTCSANGKWKSSTGRFVTPTCKPVCGRPMGRLLVHPAIIGGNNIPEYTIPWQVLLKVNNTVGGGMVIADRWIITAAHLARQATNPVSNDTVQVYLGKTDVQSLMVSPVYAASVHIHPDYNKPVLYNNDIALIKLQDPITFDSSVMPICLPAQNATYVTGTMGLVSGFGITQEMGNSTKKLKYFHLPVVDQETCSESFTTSQEKLDRGQILTDNMVCSGVPEGGKDSCSGDAGSAFALKDNGQFWAAGIVSWGTGCGRQGTYEVYTRVANYLDWIAKTMQEN